MTFNLPLVMPADRVKMALQLESRFPNRLGILLCPPRWRDCKGLPFAVDNGRFGVWAKGQSWSQKSFENLLAKINDPLWVAVPDVVADAENTFKEWKKWAKVLNRDWPVALVVQDGMTPKDISSLRPLPDWIFVGGTTKFKWRTLRDWTKNFNQVHVGRANTKQMLWAAHHAGADSTDGTGWWHDKQHTQLIDYLIKSQKGLSDKSHTQGFFNNSLR